MSTTATQSSSPTIPDRSRSPSPSPSSLHRRRSTPIVPLLITILLLFAAFTLVSALYLITHHLLPAPQVSSEILSVCGSILTIIYCCLHVLTIHPPLFLLPASALSSTLNLSEKFAARRGLQPNCLPATSSVVGRLLLLVSIGAIITGLAASTADPVCRSPLPSQSRSGCILHRTTVACAVSTFVLSLALILILEIGHSPSPYATTTNSSSSRSHRSRRATGNTSRSPRSSQAARYSFSFSVESALSHLHLRLAPDHPSLAPDGSSTHDFQPAQPAPTHQMHQHQHHAHPPRPPLFFNPTYTDGDGNPTGSGQGERAEHRESYRSLAPTNASTAAFSFQTFTSLFSLPTINLSKLSLFAPDHEHERESSPAGSLKRWGNGWIGAIEKRASAEQAAVEAKRASRARAREQQQQQQGATGGESGWGWRMPDGAAGLVPAALFAGRRSRVVQPQSMHVPAGEGGVLMKGKGKAKGKEKERRSAAGVTDVPVVKVGGWMDWFEDGDDEDDGPVGVYVPGQSAMFDRDGMTRWPDSPGL